jgi:TATA-binding protein-associated factor Taf7
MENINLDKIIKADELDTNMILSVPEEIGLLLQRIIQGQASSEEKNETNIEIIENSAGSMDMDESRKMIFKINDTLLPVTILDFPSIIEAQKSIDNKNFYKSGDISQMMFVHDREHRLVNEEELPNFNPFKANDETFNKIVWKKDYDHKYKLRSGLGKSSKNVRAKRFKRKIRYNGEEILDVAKKLKSIIDHGAVNFENQMKNKESLAESIENQSIIHSISEVNTENVGNNFIIPMEKGLSSSAKKKVKAPHEFNAPINTKKLQASASNLSFNIALQNEKEEKSIMIGTGSSNNISGNMIFINPQVNMVNQQSIAMNQSNIKISQISQEPQISKEEQMLIDEYNALKSEYKIIKKQLEENADDQEKLRRKKKIKKRLKEIKKTYKGDGNADDED